jgi:hypothetical protein
MSLFPLLGGMFMRLWKNSILIVGAVVLIMSSLTVSAEELTDGTGDIYHWKYSETEWSWQQYTGDKPNIDITRVSYSVSENTLTATMEVNGIHSRL